MESWLHIINCKRYMVSCKRTMLVPPTDRERELTPRDIVAGERCVQRRRNWQTGQTSRQTDRQSEGGLWVGGTGRRRPLGGKRESVHGVGCQVRWTVGPLGPRYHYMEGSTFIRGASGRGLWMWSNGKKGLWLRMRLHCMHTTAPV